MALARNARRHCVLRRAPGVAQVVVHRVRLVAMPSPRSTVRPRSPSWPPRRVLPGGWFHRCTHADAEDSVDEVPDRPDAPDSPRWKSLGSTAPQRPAGRHRPILRVTRHHDRMSVSFVCLYFKRNSCGALWCTLNYVISFFFVFCEC